MGYLIFRGVSTESLTNVYVSEMPSHKKAAMRFTEYNVKGRDGVLHVDEGFDNFDIKVVLVLLNAGTASRYQVNAWADGSGRLISSDDLTKAYRATVLKEVVWKRVKAASAVKVFSAATMYAANDLTVYGGAVYKFKAAHTGTWSFSDVDAYCYTDSLFDTATITFNCQPFLYEASESVIEYTADATFLNPGSADALPLIRVDGSGNASFSLAGETISIAGMVSGTPVYIDCETGYVYTANGATEMTGEFPVLPLTPNAQSPIVLDLISGVTKITLTPRWRWV